MLSVLRSGCECVRMSCRDGRSGGCQHGVCGDTIYDIINICGVVAACFMFGPECCVMRAASVLGVRAEGGYEKGMSRSAALAIRSSVLNIHYYPVRIMYG